jgi:hypothetical protein
MPAPDGRVHDLRRIGEVLEGHGVEYLLVGGVAAIGYRATRPTEDADCVVRRTRANLEKLAAVLRGLNARLRVAGLTDDEAKALPVRIDPTTLDRAGMTTWMTDAGAFDVLVGLEASDGRLKLYDELAERSTILRGDGFIIRAAALDDIIEAKERAHSARRLCVRGHGVDQSVQLAWARGREPADQTYVDASDDQAKVGVRVRSRSTARAQGPISSIRP